MRVRLPLAGRGRGVGSVGRAPHTRGATTYTPAGGPPEARRTRSLHRRTRTWTHTRCALRAHPWGPASSPRQPRAVASRPTSRARTRSSRRRPEHHFRASPSRSGRSGWTTTGRWASSPSIRQRSGDALRLLLVPGRLWHRHAHVQPSHDRASVQPCEVPFRDPLRQPRVGAPPRRAGSLPGTARCSRPRTCRVRVDDWTAPSLAPHSGALWRTGWHRGHEEACDGLHGQRRDHGDAPDRGRRAARRPGLPRRALAGLGAMRFHPAAAVRRRCTGRARARTRLRSPTARTGCASRLWTPPATWAA